MKFLLVSFFVFVSHLSFAAESCVFEIPIQGAIGPSTLDLIDRGVDQAKDKACKAILMTINTPGGSLQSTRYIVERILNSELPFLCLVYPSGAHAGSAGAIIMQACHVNGAVEATNIGAATPVAGGGQEMGEDMRNKIMNDTRSWVEGLAKRRERNEEFAKDIVEKAKAVSASEAAKIKATDWVGNKKADFLEFAKGRKVKLSEDQTTEVSFGDEVILMPLDLRYQVLDFVSNPQFAYLIFMGSLGLLYFELTHPGVIAPGVIGALGLVISLMSMHMLDVSTTGILLILLGLALMIAEAFVVSFGALGIGGVVAFFLGSLFLYDSSFSGYSLPLVTILPTTLILGFLMIGIAYLALSTRKRKNTTSFDGLVGLVGKVSSVGEDGVSGQIEVNGELWSFVSVSTVKVGDSAEVLSAKGFKLNIKKYN